MAMKVKNYRVVELTHPGGLKTWEVQRQVKDDLYEPLRPRYDHFDEACSCVDRLQTFQNKQVVLSTKVVYP
jgi:hypothetical protein